MKGSRLNNKIIDDRLKDSLIKRIGNYKNNYIEIEFKCLLCNNTDYYKPFGILRGQNCKHCFGGKKLLNKNVDMDLSERNIIRLDDLDGKNKTERFNWKCLICNHEWKNSASRVIYEGSGCLICSRNKKGISNEYINDYNDNIDHFLSDKNIKRISSYSGWDKEVEFKCLICNNLWTDEFNDLKNGAYCKICDVNNIIDNNVKNKKITRIDNFKGYHEKIKFQCNICEKYWDIRPGDVISKNVGAEGCTECSGNSKLNNTIIDNRMKDRSIIRVGDYKNNHFSIKWKCVICDYIWSAPPSCVAGTGTGCTKCKRFSLGEEAILKILDRNNIKYTKNYNIYINGLIPGERPKLVDFYLPEYELIIEYNGAQHYIPVTFGGISMKKAQEKFENQQIRDQKVREFASMNNTEIYEIDYRKYSRKILRQRDLTFEEALEIDLYYHLNKIEEYWSMMGYHPDDRKHYDTFGMPDMKYFKSIING